MFQKIFLDAGHGGSDSGALGADGLKESEITFNITQALGKKLVDSGKNVEFTTVNKGEYVELSARAQKANKWGADLFFSIHINADGDPHNAGFSTAKGEEILVYSMESTAASLASLMVDDINALVPGGFRGVKQRKDLTILKRTRMPAILLECGFIDNPVEGKKLANYPEQSAEVIKNALLSAIQKIENDSNT